jgi:streptogramin lyase
VKPVNSDTPYSLAVDLKRERVWVNGNQSDSIYGFNIKTEKWIQIPLPKRTSFTRDIDFDEQGNIFTANSNFPSWHIEGGQPTTMRIEVGEF